MYSIAAIGWLAAIVVFLLAEAATVSLVSIWFAVGALAAVIVCLLHGAAWLQFTVFLVVAGVLLALLRPLVRKFVRPRLTATNVDALVGSQGIVTAAIDNVAAVGQVKLGAMTWTARSTTGTPIPEGTQVKVDRIAGVKAFVTPVEVPTAV